MAAEEYEPFPLDPVVGREAIAERVAELERLVSRLAERNGQLSQLLTRYASGEHVEALKPFAAVAIPDNWPDEAPLWWDEYVAHDDGKKYLSIGHGRIGTGGIPISAYRRARQLVHGLPVPSPAESDVDGEVD